MTLQSAPVSAISKALAAVPTHAHAMTDMWRQATEDAWHVCRLSSGVSADDTDGVLVATDCADDCNGHGKCELTNVCFCDGGYAATSTGGCAPGVSGHFFPDWHFTILLQSATKAAAARECACLRTRAHVPITTLSRRRVDATSATMVATVTETAQA